MAVSPLTKYILLGYNSLSKCHDPVLCEVGNGTGASEFIEKSAGTISRTDLKNLSPEALQNLRLEFAPDIMARFFKPKLAGGGMILDNMGLANILAV